MPGREAGLIAVADEGIGKRLLAAAIASLCCSAALAQPISERVPAREEAAPFSTEEVLPRGKAAPTASAPRSGAVEELFDHVRFLQEEMRQLRRLLEQQGHKLSEAERRQLNRYLDTDRRLSALEQETPQAEETPEGTAAEAPSQSPPGERLAYQQAYGQVKNGAYDEAMASFRAFLQRWPTGEYAANSWYWLGELHLAAAPPNLKAAEQSFARVLEGFPAHHKVPDAMFKIGKVRHLLGELEQAQAILQRVVEEYGDTAGSAARLAEAYLTQYFK